MKKIITLLLISIFCFAIKKANAQVPYSFQEGFETTNPLTFWTQSAGMLSGVNIQYTFDNSTFTEGIQSMYITASIPGHADTNASWYYYLKIPIIPIPNLEDSLSFSLDVKIDSLSALGTTIGFNLPFYPTSDGVHTLPPISTYNQWSTFYYSNLQETTLNPATRWINKYIYDGNITTVGRAIDYVGVLFRGKGAKTYSINLDNLIISGNQTDPADFTNNYTNNWPIYVARVKDSIDVRQIRRNNLDAIPDTTNLALCPIYRYKINEMYDYIYAIDSILPKMYLKNNSSSYFPTEWMTSLDNYLQFYEEALVFINSNLNKNDPIIIYNFPAMKYFRLKGKNTPSLDTVSSYNLRMTPDEYQSIGTLILPSCTYGKISVENTDFVGASGTFPKENLDMYIAKIWYQAGLQNTLKTGKFLTQELLLKQENLVKVDYLTETNYLKVTNNGTGLSEYIDISDPSGAFPNTNDITFNDSTLLQPFELDSIRHKLLWSIVHVPPNTAVGDYTSTVTLRDSLNNILKQFSVNITVLPFSLDRSRLTYSLYYHGLLYPNANPVYTFLKEYNQKLLELTDMKKHGVLYPVSYDPLSTMDTVLEMRNEVGLPTDRFYTLGVRNYSPALDITSAISKLAAHGYNSDSLYVYGIDEADTTELLTEIASNANAHSAGARVFTAGYSFTYDYIGSSLDLINYAYGVTAEDIDMQVAQWHSAGQQIFAYASPQVGVENPEVYRRNFGCLLWQKGFDGAMNYAYQKQYGTFWNDFDSRQTPTAAIYREEAFTYPTTNGIVGTVEWEGYRAAITDIKYISTLLNIRDTLVANGKDVSNLDNWINSIDCSADLDVLREEVIDKILFYDPNISTGMSKNIRNEQISIYPNPTTNQLHIYSESLINKILIIDINGKVIQEEKGNTIINIENLTRGIYFLKIETESGVVNKRFIKQ